uniref:F-box domain-containing protein n=1 Tax=Rhizochromulina marina TaxID=1034831 RepID=A0A7S2R400_9STRA|mmetsp:Transcript_10408/g.29750  ORF Transcript_10408/g.29750 Transcript_10408/m.29750 type:complete len:829 (+) Transcript_10408:39-2525(+)
MEAGTEAGGEVGACGLLLLAPPPALERVTFETSAVASGGGGRSSPSKGVAWTIPMPPPPLALGPEAMGQEWTGHHLQPAMMDPTRASPTRRGLVAPWKQLPLDLWETCLWFLAPVDGSLVMAGMVCQQWQSIVIGALPLWSTLELSRRVVHLPLALATTTSSSNGGGASFPHPFTPGEGSQPRLSSPKRSPARRAGGPRSQASIVQAVDDCVLWSLYLRRCVTVRALTCLNLANADRFKGEALARLLDLASSPRPPGTMDVPRPGPCPLLDLNLSLCVGLQLAPLARALTFCPALTSLDLHGCNHLLHDRAVGSFIQALWQAAGPGATPPLQTLNLSRNPCGSPELASVPRRFRLLTPTATSTPDDSSCESLGPFAIQAIARQLLHLSTLSLANHTRLSEAAVLFLVPQPPTFSAPPITALDLSACSRLTSVSVNHLVSLLPIKELQVSKCWRLDASCIEHMIHSPAILGRIQSLCVNSCPQLSGAMLAQVVRTAEDFRGLSASRSRLSDHDLYAMTLPLGDAVLAASTSPSPQLWHSPLRLETVNISRCRGVTSDGVLSLCLHSQGFLTSLNVSDCPEVDSSFLVRAAQVPHCPLRALQSLNMRNCGPVDDQILATLLALSGCGASQLSKLLIGMSPDMSIATGAAAGGHSSHRNCLSSAGLDLLSRTAGDRLEVLDIEGAGLVGSSAVALVLARCNRLRRLNMSGTAVSPETLMLLANPRVAPSLVEISLRVPPEGQTHSPVPPPPRARKSDSQLPARHEGAVTENVPQQPTASAAAAKEVPAVGSAATCTEAWEAAIKAIRKSRPDIVKKTLGGERPYRRSIPRF